MRVQFSRRVSSASEALGSILSPVKQITSIHTYIPIYKNLHTYIYVLYEIYGYNISIY